MKAVRKGPQESSSSAREAGKKNAGFSDEERAAMKERALELKKEARGGSRPGAADGLVDVLARIAALPEPDRSMAERIHEIIVASAPELRPRTWYGMPAYAKDGAVVCFFQSAQKFKSRYATLGFSDKAHLDDGRMWPTAFALQQLTPAEEARIAELVRRAVG